MGDTPSDSSAPAWDLAEIAVNGLRFALNQPTLVVGRSADCAIRLEDKKTSGQHAMFLVSAAGVSIRDLESRNGIRVNDKKVPHASLALGDIVGIGLRRFVIVKRGEPVPAALLAKPSAELAEGHDQVDVDAALDNRRDAKPASSPGLPALALTPATAPAPVHVQVPVSAPPSPTAPQPFIGVIPTVAAADDKDNKHRTSSSRRQRAVKGKSTWHEVAVAVPAMMALGGLGFFIVALIMLNSGIGAPTPASLPPAPTANKGELETLNTMLSALRGEIGELKERRDKLEADLAAPLIAKTQGELDARDQRMSELQQTLRDTSNQMNTLLERLDKLEAAINTLKSTGADNR